MALLKEDGSLDVERINKLPLKEFIHELGTLTQEQYKDYIAKIPINESQIPVRAVRVHSAEEYGVEAVSFLNNIREKYGLM